MNNTALMVRLLTRLKVEMNGAVTEAMEQGGVHYPLNYGVSVPTIKQIAREYGPNHSLALLLYQQQVRELKLAALFIENPAEVTPTQVEEWSRGFIHTEMVEMTIMYLFSHCAAADPFIELWLQYSNPLLQYAALLMIGRVAGNEHCAESRCEKLLPQISGLLDRSENLPPYLIRAAANAVGRSAALSAPLHTQCEELLQTYRTSSKHSLQEVARELEWML